jgi:hypothetical protein
MYNVNVKIIEELKKFVRSVGENKVLLDKFRCFDGDFTRTRKLPLATLVLLITRLCKKTLSVEIEQFFEEMGVSTTCSVSAFSQQRHKLGASFFYCWNNVLCYYFYLLYGNKVRRWKDYRVLAGDGSSVSLTSTPALRQYFGGQTNQHSDFVMGKTFYCYDVLNKLVVYSYLAPYRYGEVPMAYQHIDWLESDMLMIYDRNFYNYKMIALHQWQEREIKFVIRAKEKLPMIASFIASGQASAIVQLVPGAAAIKGLRESGYIVSKTTAVTIRLVRVELTDSVEVLATNLWEHEGHRSSEFKDIYFMRWGIETSISFQKNILQMEAFSGVKVNTVLQDFYATMFINNLHSILIKKAQETVDRTRTANKYPLKINNNKSFGKLRKQLVPLFYTSDAQVILQYLHDHFIRDPLPVRKGRSFERIRKNPQIRSKHRMFTNFKPSY